MSKVINICSHDDLVEVSSFILSTYKKKIIAIYGDLGSGKTTLVKNFCNYLNVLDNVSSPTFPVINEYLDNEGNKIFHFDFYRINTIQEALDIGTDLFLDSGCYCFIEWPKLILPLLNDDVLFLNLKIQNNKRQLTIL